MFSSIRFKELLVKYKTNFIEQQWKDEKYKWEAVKCFQDNWNVNDSDFTGMLERSLGKTNNLLASLSFFPKSMIIAFSQRAPEEVRAMFIALFDESKDVCERIEAFKMQATVILEKYGNGAAQHYQSENAITTYLWLRYPDKYYIYKFKDVKNVADKLESNYTFKRAAYTDNIRNFLRLYDEISQAVKEDTELVKLFQSQLTDSCYPDPEFRTLTVDIGFFISRIERPKQDERPEPDDDKNGENDSGLFSEDWFPPLEEYTPGVTKELWLSLLRNKKIFRWYDSFDKQ